MKKYLYSLLVIAIVTLPGACKKGGYTSTAPMTDGVDTNAMVKYTGIFANGPFGTAYGRANISEKEGKFTLVLIDVAISSGPDLHVYLSKELLPVNFLDLGNLKSVGGTQVYEIAGTPDFAQYKYVLIHCQLFDHLFGSARIS